MLGNIFMEDHEGLPHDFERAAFWHKKAAQQGVAPAPFALGHAYENGLGVAQDPAAAIQWIGKASKQGLASAQFRLGVLHAEGRGTKKDLVQAYVWFSIAAVGLSHTSEDGAAIAARKRDMLGEAMSPEQLSAAHEMLR